MEIAWKEVAPGCWRGSVGTARVEVDVQHDGSFGWHVERSDCGTYVRSGNVTGNPVEWVKGHAGAVALEFAAIPTRALWRPAL